MSMIGETYMQQQLLESEKRQERLLQDMHTILREIYVQIHEERGKGRPASDLAFERLMKLEGNEIGKTSP